MTRMTIKGMSRCLFKSSFVRVCMPPAYISVKAYYAAMNAMIDSGTTSRRSRQTIARCCQ